ncbi:YceI family protein [Reichenbachiella sp.]|uniref:YceI family protein n=1 Tax=Reichenbachiella sp. TaxID=2184521 RepID=UPI00329A7520
MNKLTVLAALNCIIIFNANAQNINTGKSLISFEVSNMAFNSVEGTFKGMKGNVLLDLDSPEGAILEACIDVSTVDTANGKRDNHLLEEDFFYADKFPTICFSSTAIMQTSNGYLAAGQLAMRGVTKSVEIPFTYEGKVLTGTLQLKRLAYKIGEGTSKFMVGNDVDIIIEAHLK